MIDSYNSYLSRIVQAQTTFKQCLNKIAYFLQIPVEFSLREISEFIHLPIRHICLLNDLFQSLIVDHPPVTNSIDWKIIEGKDCDSLVKNSVRELNYFRCSTSCTTSQCDFSIIVC